MNEDKPFAKGEAKSPLDRDRDATRGDARTPLGTHPVGTAAGAVAGDAAGGPC